MIRPLLPDDVVDCQRIAARAIDALDVQLGDDTPTVRSEEAVAMGRARIAHLQGTDPGGAWVAEADGRPVGCALALVRDGMWYLSLLMVDPEHQGKGIGRALLRAALGTATDRSWILSSEDPAAVRSYQRAGFALHPGFTAKGSVDRAKIPAVQGIRDGTFADRELVDGVALAVRGARLGPDFDYLCEGGRFLVDEGGRGWVVPSAGGLRWLAATDEDTARRLLWAALAEAGDQVEFYWLTAAQQWAIDVSLDAGLALKSGPSVCLRGQPLASPYLPNGALG